MLSSVISIVSRPASSKACSTLCQLGGAMSITFCWTSHDPFGATAYTGARWGLRLLGASFHVAASYWLAYVVWSSLANLTTTSPSKAVVVWLKTCLGFPAPMWVYSGYSLVKRVMPSIPCVERYVWKASASLSFTVSRWCGLDIVFRLRTISPTLY